MLEIAHVKLFKKTVSHQLVLLVIKQNQKPDLLVNRIAKRKTRQHKKVLIETTTSNYLTIEKLTVRKKKRIQD